MHACVQHAWHWIAAVGTAGTPDEHAVTRQCLAKRTTRVRIRYTVKTGGKEWEYAVNIPPLNIKHGTRQYYGTFLSPLSCIVHCTTPHHMVVCATVDVARQHLSDCCRRRNHRWRAPSTSVVILVYTGCAPMPCYACWTSAQIFAHTNSHARMLFNTMRQLGVKGIHKKKDKRECLVFSTDTDNGPVNAWLTMRCLPFWLCF